MTGRGRAALFGLGAAVAAATCYAAVPVGPLAEPLAGPPAGLFRAEEGWQEIAWPFPRDAWPAGRAFRCGGAGCGGAMEAYVRPKIGFCNCAPGGSGDAEVDGVSDLDMISPDFRPRGPGAPVVVGGMAGRVRGYVLTTADGEDHPAAGFALSARCDLIAVASLGPAAGSDGALRGIAALLETETVAVWIRSKLGKG